MKKLLIFSHSSILEINRKLYYKLSDHFQVEIRIVCPKFWKGDLIQDLTVEQNTSNPEIEIISLPVHFSGNGSLFYYKKNPAKILNSWIPDLVFCDEEPWSASCFQIFRSFPHSELFFYTKQNIRKFLPFPFNLIQKYNFMMSKRCFSVSEEVTNVLRWKGYKGKIEYLPHSFEAEKFYPRTDAQKNNIRSALGIKNNQYIVGYFGRLEPEKGIQDMLSAIRIFANNNSIKPIFLIVGNGKLKSSISKFIADNQDINIILKEAIPHNSVSEVLSILDMLLLPSRTTKKWKEQFGRILVEAMACGIAVLGSDSGEIPHLIKKSNGGMIFQEENPQDLAEKIRFILNDEKKLNQFKNNGYMFTHNTLTHDKLALDLGKSLGLQKK